MDKQKKIYFETYGCTSNKSDSEIMAGIAQKAGAGVSDNIKNADMIVVNTCIVKQKTENKITHRLEKLIEKYPDKRIIVAGCMPKSASSTRIPKGCETLDSIDDITGILNKIHPSTAGEFIQFKDADKVSLPALRRNSATDVIQISTGCMSYCTFCGTKKARGNTRSSSPDVIAERIVNAFLDNVKQFWLTSQDCGCYGYDLKPRTNLASLISQITGWLRNQRVCYEKNKTNDFYLPLIRVGMMNPTHLIRKSDAAASESHRRFLYEDLIEAYKNPHVYKFLHIPVQSGSDKILADMKRGHTADDFVKIVDAFRREIPEITIWTDIITGFPGETESDFEDTIFECFDFIKNL